ncbi:MAG: hypothetical protein EBR09_05440 [Proteobacteria bacterium]|nr:hypothetical protein [Pseudomonadota bacterium]
MVDDSGNALLYRPEGFDVAMQAYRRAEFKDGQSCSGTMVHEADKADPTKFNIYFMTAHHCLYNVTPLGNRYTVEKDSSGKEVRKPWSPEQKEVEFTLSSFVPRIEFGDQSKVFKESKRNFPLRYKTRIYVWDKANTAAEFKLQPEMYYSMKSPNGKSDVVRFPIKTGVSEQEAKASSVQVCPTPLPLEAVGLVNFSLGALENSLRAGTPLSKPLRMMIGLGKDQTGKKFFRRNNGELLLERMTGRHFLKGRVTGEYRPLAQLAAMQDFVFAAMAMDGLNFYGYTNYFGGGAEGSDSGSPVFEGLQESPKSRQDLTQDISFHDPEDSGKVQHWKIKSMGCVSGVLAREMSHDPMKATGAIGVGKGHENSEDLKELGRETTTIIQEVSTDASGGWRKL